MFGFGRRKPPAPDPRILRWPDRPDMVYAIGDIHGCFQELLALEEKIAREIEASNQSSVVVYLGDLIDRGPDSFSVLEHLSRPRPGLERVILSGNHEEMFLDFFDSPSPRSDWLQYGGVETLHSYGLEAASLFAGSRNAAAQKLAHYFPPEHLALVRNLPICLSMPDLVLVHAGLEADTPLEEQSVEEMVWRRLPVPAYSAPQPFGLVVHGHTPAKMPVIEDFRICIDTGAFATGVLSAVAIDRDNRPRILNSHGSPS